MDRIYIYLAVGGGIVFFLLGWYLKNIGRKELEEENAAAAFAAQQSPVKSADPEMRRLQLQAYERLTILCERMGFTHLLSRCTIQKWNCAEMQSFLIQSIRAEFEYNVSQRIYVSTAAWDGIEKLKEQQIFIINQLGTMVSPTAPATLLAEKIAVLLAQDEKASLQPIVAELLRNEARKIM